MKKVLGAAAVCALAVGLVTVPAVAKTHVKHVGGTVSVTVTPTTVTYTPGPPAVVGPLPATLSVSGNVSSNSSCRKSRTVHLYYSGAPTTEVGSAVTGPNGDYTATIPSPIATGQTVNAKVDQAFRKFASKRKGKKPKRGRTAFDCMEITGSSGAITVTPPPAV
jgi:hypothetical protein